MKTMEHKEALNILRQHNAWRRNDEESEQGNPALIGQAIDVAIEVIEQRITTGPQS